MEGVGFTVLDHDRTTISRDLIDGFRGSAYFHELAPWRTRMRWTGPSATAMPRWRWIFPQASRATWKPGAGRKSG
ncbi:hypothetical protein RAA17_00275 [Komagataeibacter rhaeticus]|nr:hypothetical protein [Komagataeibacter rhaeticus]